MVSDEDRSFFLKYADYRNGMRLTIRKDGHGFLIEHNVTPNDDDMRFSGSLESFDEFRIALQKLYPEKWGDGRTQGENWFLHVFQELFHQVERHKRKYPVEKARRRKTPHKK